MLGARPRNTRFVSQHHLTTSNKSWVMLAKYFRKVQTASERQHPQNLFYIHWSDADQFLISLGDEF